MTCFVLNTGTTLRKYCLEKGLNYSTIYKRLDRLGITPEEALKMGNSSCKYKMNGLSVRKLLGPQKYDKFLHTMRRKRLSVEEAYNLVINGKREEINLE